MTQIGYGPFITHKQKTYSIKAIKKVWFSHMEYKYIAIQGNLPDVYAFKVPHNVCYKVSELPLDAVPCGDVEDSKKGWRILDHQPLNLPPITLFFHYNLIS